MLSQPTVPMLCSLTAARLRAILSDLLCHLFLLLSDEDLSEQAVAVSDRTELVEGALCLDLSPLVRKAQRVQLVVQLIRKHVGRSALLKEAALREGS